MFQHIPPLPPSFSVPQEAHPYRYLLLYPLLLLLPFPFGGYRLGHLSPAPCSALCVVFLSLRKSTSHGGSPTRAPAPTNLQGHTPPLPSAEPSLPSAYSSANSPCQFLKPLEPSELGFISCWTLADPLCFQEGYRGPCCLYVKIPKSSHSLLSLPTSHERQGMPPDLRTTGGLPEPLEGGCCMLCLPKFMWPQNPFLVGGISGD